LFFIFKNKKNKKFLKMEDVPIPKLPADEVEENSSDGGNRDNEGSPTPLHYHKNKSDPDEIIRRSVSESVSAVRLEMKDAIFEAMSVFMQHQKQPRSGFSTPAREDVDEKATPLTFTVVDKNWLLNLGSSTLKERATPPKNKKIEQVPPKKKSSSSDNVTQRNSSNLENFPAYASKKTKFQKSTKTPPSRDESDDDPSDSDSDPESSSEDDGSSESDDDEDNRDSEHSRHSNSKKKKNTSSLLVPNRKKKRESLLARTVKLSNAPRNNVMYTAIQPSYNSFRRKRDEEIH
jgi:hypothetical protein